MLVSAIAQLQGFQNKVMLAAWSHEVLLFLPVTSTVVQLAAV